MPLIVVFGMKLIISININSIIIIIMGDLISKPKDWIRYITLAFAHTYNTNYCYHILKSFLATLVSKSPNPTLKGNEWVREFKRE